MAYNTSFSSLVRDDLKKTEGKRELVKASLPEKLMKKKGTSGAPAREPGG